MTITSGECPSSTPDAGDDVGPGGKSSRTTYPRPPMDRSKDGKWSCNCKRTKWRCWALETRKLRRGDVELWMIANGHKTSRPASQAFVLTIETAASRISGDIS